MEESGDNMRYLIILLILLFTCSFSSSNGGREYKIIKIENVNNDFIFIGCILLDKNTKDTVSKFLVLPEEYYLNYHTYKNNFFCFEKFYQGMYDPPFHELQILRFEILFDTLLFKDNYSFGHYPDSVFSKFEGNLLTIFKGDSIIEFDLNKFEEIKRYKNVNFNMREQ